MKHIFIPHESAKETFILLHGTGGTEQSLLPIAKDISDRVNYLGIRGNVTENGMPRFFRRLREGVFDIEDLKFRTEELADAIKELSVKYNFSLQETYLLGYSNGANMAGNLLLNITDIAKGAILLHPMVPSRDYREKSLKGKNILISAGTEDPLIPYKEAEELYKIFMQLGAATELYSEKNDHRISFSEIEHAKKWFENQKEEK